MTHTPSLTGRDAALVVRLCEAALEPGGWAAVAKALEREEGFGLAITFRAESSQGGPESQAQDAARTITVPGLGTWSLTPPSGAVDPIVLPDILTDALALAFRIGAGLPLVALELETVLAHVPYAAILLDGRAGLLFANAEAEDLLASRQLVRPSRPGARLQPVWQRADEVLDAAATRILDEGHPGASWIFRRPGEGHLAIRLRPVGPRPGPAPFHPDREPVARLLLTMRAIGPERTGRAPRA